MFFDFPEIVIIFGVALVVLGPKKLPGTAAQIGRWVGRARAMARQFREQLELEVNSVESALDTNAAHKQTIKGPAASSSVAATDIASPPGALEAPPEDPAMLSAPGMGWDPGYAESEERLAPYGDPDAIPQAEASEAQLSLQLGPPPAAPSAAPHPAAAANQDESR